MIDKIKEYLSINKDIHLLNDGSIGFDILYKICQSLTKNKIVIASNYDDLFANLKDNGVAVSSLCREDIKLARLYDKRTSGNLDMYPFGNLFLNQIGELAVSLDIDKSLPELHDERIPVQTHIKYIELKKYDLLNEDIGIITNKELPMSYNKWYAFTLIQKEQIVFLHNRQKNTEHKEINSKRILKF